MSALMVATITVKDPADFSAYLEKSKAIASRFGAQMKFRGKKIRELAGDPVAGDLMIMVEFPSAEDIDGWFDSPEYAESVALREAGSIQVLTAYEAAA